MTEKESLTHEIEDDLAARNRNWNKVDRNTTNIAENTTNIAENTTNIADKLALKRVDTLTGRMQITSKNYASPNVVPPEGALWGNLYLICFELQDSRNAPCIIWRGHRW